MSKELANVNDSQEFLVPTLAQQFTGERNDFITSIKTDDTPESKAKLYNYMTTNDFVLGEFVGKTIYVKDFVIYNVNMLDEKTGELIPAQRTVFIDDKGKSYGTVSKGIFESLRNIVTSFGMPDTWGENGLPLQPKQVRTRQGFQTMIIIVDFKG